MTESPRLPSWKIIDRGDVPYSAQPISYTCPACDRDADLPVKGIALAQLAGGALVFDRDAHAMPKVIQCPHCRRRFESAA